MSDLTRRVWTTNLCTATPRGSKNLEVLRIFVLLRSNFQDYGGGFPKWITEYWTNRSTLLRIVSRSIDADLVEAHVSDSGCKRTGRICLRSFFLLEYWWAFLFRLAKHRLHCLLARTEQECRCKNALLRLYMYQTRHFCECFSRAFLLWELRTSQFQWHAKHTLTTRCGLILSRFQVQS